MGRCRRAGSGKSKIRLYMFDCVTGSPPPDLFTQTRIVTLVVKKMSRHRRRRGGLKNLRGAAVDPTVTMKFGLQYLLCCFVDELFFLCRSIPKEARSSHSVPHVQVSNNMYIYAFVVGALYRHVQGMIGPVW